MDPFSFVLFAVILISSLVLVTRAVSLATSPIPLPTPTSIPPPTPGPDPVPPPAPIPAPAPAPAGLPPWENNVVTTDYNTLLASFVSGYTVGNTPPTLVHYDGQFYFGSFEGGVLTPNGKIVAINDGNPASLVFIDTTVAVDTPTVSNTERNFYSGAFNTNNIGGGVLAPNGIVYLWGKQLVGTNDMAKVDTTQLVGSALTVLSSGISDSTNVADFKGGALGPNGVIYLVPYNYQSDAAKKILKYDTATDSFLTPLTYTDTQRGTATFNLWDGAVTAPNGKIYFIPSRSPNVLVIDTQNSDAITFIPTGLTDSNDKYSGGVLGPDDKIYCAPSNAGGTTPKLLVIDTSNDTVSTVDLTGVIADDDFELFNSGCLGPDRKIYFAPYFSKTILVIDPSVGGTFESHITYTFTDNFGEYSGAVLAPDGKIHFMPFAATNTVSSNPQGMVLDFGVTPNPVPGIEDFVLSRLYNKY